MDPTSATLTELCNGDKSARIRFEFFGGQDQHIFNSATTSIEELASGNVSLDAGDGARL